MEIKSMSKEELKTELTTVILKQKIRVESNKILINLREEMNYCLVDYEITRFNGGWCKLVTGIDKSKIKGKSILGNFVSDSKATEKEYWEIGSIFLDCGYGGSIKNIVRNYHLFVLQDTGIMKLLKFESSPDYAVNFWELIEKELNK